MPILPKVIKQCNFELNNTTNISFTKIRCPQSIFFVANLSLNQTSMIILINVGQSLVSHLTVAIFL